MSSFEDLTLLVLRGGAGYDGCSRWAFEVLEVRGGRGGACSWYSDGAEFGSMDFSGICESILVSDYNAVRCTTLWFFAYAMRVVTASTARSGLVVIYPIYCQQQPP